MERIDIVLDLKKGRISPKNDIKIQQFDKNCYETFINVQNNGEIYDLSSKTVRVQGVKPDGKSILVQAEITNAAYGMIKISFDEQATIVNGLLRLQLLIFGSNDFLKASVPFLVVVGDSLNVGEEVASTDIFTELVQKLNTLDEWDRYFTETSGAIEQKYTERLNGLDSQMAETMKYPILDGEVGVINKGYPWGDVRRYGVFPNTDINYDRDTPYIQNALRNSRDLGFTVIFPSGFYKTELNIGISNVTIKVDKGTEFAGLIHVGLVNGEGEIENIKMYGRYTNYDRFGTFKVNGLYVEEIHVKSDGSKTINYPNLKSRGVHIYGGTKNMECRLMIVDDADQNALNTEGAVAIDGYQSNPQNLKIGKIWVKKSDVHGVYITGSGHNIGEIQVDEFGAGEYKWSGLQDSNGKLQSQELKGVWLNRIENSTIGKIVVNQNTEGTRAFAKYHVMIDETGINRYGTISIGDIICSNVISASRGVCLGDRTYPCPRCIVDIKTVTINGVTGVSNITDYGLFNIQDNVNANISSIFINNSDLKDCIKIYRNSKTIVGLIDLGDIKGQGLYCEGELNLRELRCNRISSSGGFPTASFRTHSHRCKIGRLILGATVAVTVKALELYSLINFQIDYLEIGQYRNTIGNIDIDTCQYTNILFLKAPGQTNKEGIGLRLNNLINCSINNGSIINYAQGIRGTGYLTRCCMSNVNNAGNTVSTDIPKGTLQLFNCQAIELP